MDALEMALWARRATRLAGLIHHSDRGVQYLAICYTERLAEAGALASVGSRGDSYDNALADLLRVPELFPFRFTVTVDDLRKCSQVVVERQGAGWDVVRAAS